MMVKTFEWSPKIGANSDIGRKTRSVSFGDGYEQMVDEGMNSEKQSWSLTFIKKWVDIKPILVFLRDHGETRSFKWTNPAGELGLYRAKDLKAISMGDDNWTITVSFVTAYRAGGI